MFNLLLSKIKMDEPRIISLIASATEIVCALGFESQMVGRSHECDFPASVKRLPVCTSPKFEVEGLSYEIDERVKAILQEALSVYRVDADLLERLRPTHIITQSQCEVCAVSLKDVEQAVCQFTSSQPVVVSLEPNALADVWSDIRRVADGAERAPNAAKNSSQDCGGEWTRSRRRRRTALSRPTVACHRMDRAADGGGQLDAGTGGDGRRRKPLRRGGQAFSVDDVGRTGRGRP